MCPPILTSPRIVITESLTIRRGIGGPKMGLNCVQKDGGGLGPALLMPRMATDDNLVDIAVTFMTRELQRTAQAAKMLPS